MTTDNHEWRDLKMIKRWISAQSPDRSPVAGPTQIYEDGFWRFVAGFNMGEVPVVFKACKLPLYSAGIRFDALLTRYCPDAVPALLASRQLPSGATWALYRAFSGQVVEAAAEASGQIDGLLAMARTLALIQQRFLEIPTTALVDLPLTEIQEIPAMFTHLLDQIHSHYQTRWQEDDQATLREHELPADLFPRLVKLQPQIAAWAAELAAGNWPVTIDHVDLHCGNAAVTADGRLLIFDWLESRLGCPFFSMYRLLMDVEVLGDKAVLRGGHYRPATPQPFWTPNQVALRNAYLDAIPWGTRLARERAFELAMSLAPIKTLQEDEAAQRAFGREECLPQQAAFLLGLAWPHWQQASEMTL